MHFRRDRFGARVWVRKSACVCVRVRVCERVRVCKERNFNFSFSIYMYASGWGGVTEVKQATIFLFFFFYFFSKDFSVDPTFVLFQVETYSDEFFSFLKWMSYCYSLTLLTSFFCRFFCQLRSPLNLICLIRKKYLKNSIGKAPVLSI